MNRYLPLGLATTILTGILGLWVILQPFLIQYQQVGRTFLEGTRNDVWVGAGLIAVAMVVTLAIIAESAHETASRRPMTGQ